MPRDKDLKRLVRKRMTRTGESYTAARAQLLRKKKQTTARKKSATHRSVDYARIAGMSDRAVETKTGRDWEKWVRVLDRAGASKLSHRDIARHLREEHGVDQWWSQMITVAYERVHGLRDIGQRRGGGYDANKSKTIAVPIAKLYRAVSDRRQRDRWLPDAHLKIRTSSREKSIRATWDDDTAVDFYFTAKGTAKSQVALQHRKLPNRAALERMKKYWGERLAALAEMLAG